MRALKKGNAKRVWSLLLVLALALSLAACGGEKTPSEGDGNDPGGSEGGEGSAYYNETGYPICDEPITLTMMCVTTGNPDLNDRIMVSEIEKRFGIKLDITGYASAEEFQTQLNLAMTTGDLPDLIAPCNAITMGQMREYAEDGYALALDEYADLMPNMQALMEEYPEYEKYATADDGHIYGLNSIEVNEFGRVDRVYINNQWLENVGMEVPTSVDELYEVLCAFRDQDANGNGDPNDEIPFDYAASNYYDDYMLLAAFGLNTKDANYILTEGEDGTVGFGNASENYKAYLKYMKKLYEEGLINPECYVTTEDQRNENVAKDRTGFFGAAAPFVSAGQDISYDAGFSWVGGLTSEYNDQRTVPMTNTLSEGIVMFVNAETEYPEAAVRFLDYWFSEEGEVAAQRGWEGVTMDYEYNEILKGDVATLYCPEGYESSEDYKLNKALVVGPFSYCSRTYGTHYRLLSTASDEVMQSEEVLDAYGWAVLIGNGLRQDGIVEEEVFPRLVYTEDESSRRVSLYNDLTTYIAAQRAEFITNPDVDIDASWDEYLAQLEQIGLPELLELEQAAYDRYNGN